MTLELLKKSDRIIFECIAGSRSYGTNTPESDEDIRGIFMPEKDDLISIIPTIKQVSDSNNDITYFELSRFFELASGVNPNIIELLNMPKDCIKICHPVMNKILENKHLFISKKARHTFSGYACSQIKKAKGQNKFVNNPFPVEHPKRETHCYFLSEKTNPPMRPISYNEEGFPDLSKLSVSRVTNAKDLFKLYKKPNSRGVFDSMGNILFENQSIEDEQYYIGLLQYNKESYDSYVRQWKQYWDWKKNRNEARWRDYDNSEFQCDFKNLSHCVRLMLSAKNILLNGLPLVRLEGEDLKLVKEVRSGKISYNEIIEWVEAEEAKFDEWYEKSTLPHSVDMNAVNKLYKHIINEYIFNKEK